MRAGLGWNASPSLPLQLSTGSFPRSIFFAFFALVVRSCDRYSPYVETIPYPCHPNLCRRNRPWLLCWKARILCVCWSCVDYAPFLHVHGYTINKPQTTQNKHYMQTLSNSLHGTSLRIKSILTWDEIQETALLARNTPAYARTVVERQAIALHNRIRRALCGRVGCRCGTVTQTARRYAYSNGDRVLVGDRIRFAAHGNYTSGGGYGEYGEGIVLAFGNPSSPAHLRVLCWTGRAKSSSVHGCSNDDLANTQKYVWFQGWDSATQTVIYEGRIERV